MAPLSPQSTGRPARPPALAACGKWLPPLLLVALVAGFYAGTTTNPLASDDYLLVTAAAQGPLASLRYQGGYHYYPAGMLLLSLEYSLWGTAPAGYHWTGILLLAATGLLGVALGRALGLGEPACWAAAVLLVGNGLIHEIPLWACAVLHSASVCLYLGALLAFLGHLRTGRRRYAVGCLLLYVLALLTHEQSLSLPVAAVLLLAVEPRWTRAKAPLLAMLVVGAVFGVIKLVFNDGTDLAPGLGTGLVRSAGASLLHLLRVLVPNLSWQAAWQILDPPLVGGLKLLVRVGVVAAGVAVFAALPRLGKLLALWTAAHVGMMVLAIGLSSRHYLLPLVPASLLIGLLLERMADRWPGWRRGLLVAVGVVPLLVPGIVTASARKAVWAEAGRLANRLLADAEAAVAARPDRPKLFVVNLPDGLDLGESEPAYIFRFGFEDALAWRFPGSAPGVARLRSKAPPPRTEPSGRVVSDGGLAALAADPRHLVLRYEPRSRRLVVLHP